MPTPGSKSTLERKKPSSCSLCRVNTFPDQGSSRQISSAWEHTAHSDQSSRKRKEAQARMWRCAPSRRPWRRWHSSLQNSLAVMRCDSFDSKQHSPLSTTSADSAVALRERKLMRRCTRHVPLKYALSEFAPTLLLCIPPCSRAPLLSFKPP